MLEDYLCEDAIGGGDFAPKGWMTPSALRGLCDGDLSSLWLEHHGPAHGFKKDDLAQSPSGFISHHPRASNRKENKRFMSK